MIQGGEVLIILLVALVVLGPARLPEYARKAGRYAAELRRAAREITAGLESEVSDFKSVRDELGAVRDEFKRGIEEVGSSRLEWKGPKPISGPTPEDAMRDLEEIEKQSRGDAGEEE
jgi:Tat protein translocase TatB subunit